MSDLDEIGAALQAGWGADTCDENERDTWTVSNPSRGQCGVSALVLHDRFGGELLVAEVLYPDGSHQGWHYWNRLPSGAEIDVTREQFGPDETVQAPRVVTRPAELPRRSAEQYLLLRDRVDTILGAGPRYGQIRG